MPKPTLEPYHSKILRMAFEVPVGIPKEFDRLMAVLDAEQGCDATHLLDDTRDRLLRLTNGQVSD